VKWHAAFVYLHLRQAKSARRKCRHITLTRVKQAGDVTGLLQAWMRGHPDALAELASLVHYELRQMAKRMLAGERAAYAWQPTDLINESYLRLLGWRDVEWKNRAHFFAATAKMMRRVLVDAARARQATKRGAGEAPISLDGLDVAAPATVVDVIGLEGALAELAAFDPRPAQVVEMRFFGGFTVEETADALGVTTRTVINDWNTARAWLYERLSTERRHLKP
jgi:RNA polymerase sigma factor (TIGR02999 family)